MKIALVVVGGMGGVHLGVYKGMADIELVALCDIRMDMLKEKAAGLSAKLYADYDEMLAAAGDVDAVVIMTGWDSRPNMAKKAMLAGKYTAIEVGCSQTLEECFELIDVYERTGSPLMMMENCCYGRREMMVLNMVKQGLFGEIVHCTGAYAHYLPDGELFVEMLGDNPADKVSHYRLQHYIDGNRENYPSSWVG